MSSPRPRFLFTSIPSPRIITAGIVLLLAGLAMPVFSGPAPASSAVVWDPQTRTLEFRAPDGRAWLTAGGAEIVLVDGAVIRAGDPRFTVTAALHHGRLVLEAADQRGVLDWEMVLQAVGPESVRIEWTIFNRGDKPLALDRLYVLKGRRPGRVDPDDNRLLLSGHNSWRGIEVVRLGSDEPAESYYTIAAQTPPLAAGFLAGRHNLDRFTLEAGAGGLSLTAYGECDGCVLPAGGSRSTDPLFISGGADPLASMEVFADLAARENGVRLWPDNFATWCSWYAGWIRQEPIHDYKGGLERGVEINIPLVRQALGTRGEPSMRVVDDSNEMAYGDWDNRTLAVPGGFDRLAAMMNRERIRAGIWYPPFWVSTKSRLFREHEDYLYKNPDGGVETREMYGNRIGYMDASNPAAARQMEGTAREWRERGFRYVMTDFMNWGARKSPRFDPTMTGVEAHNRGLEAMRRGFGKDTYWLHCGALLGPAMGLCDGMRISGDSHGGAIYSYTSAGTRWFYNRKVWLNDPDAIVCLRYGDAKGTAWNRSWMSWMALSGSVLTYGDTLDDLPPEYLEIYRKILPPLPAAGRPLDIWENEPYLLWGMAPGEADGPLTLFGVFEFQGKRKGKTVTLNLDEIAARRVAGGLAAVGFLGGKTHPRGRTRTDHGRAREIGFGLFPAARFRAAAAAGDRRPLQPGLAGDPGCRMESETAPPSRPRARQRRRSRHPVRARAQGNGAHGRFRGLRAG